MARGRYFLLKQPESDPPLALSKPDGFHRVMGMAVSAPSGVKQPSPLALNFSVHPPRSRNRHHSGPGNI
jgi:hypothetical protein